MHDLFYIVDKKEFITSTTPNWLESQSGRVSVFINCIINVETFLGLKCFE